MRTSGNTVSVTGRRSAALEETVAGREGMHAVVLDVDSADGIDRFAQDVVAAHPSLNVLVNNAGVMRLENIGARRDLRDAEETVTTMLGPNRLTNALLEHLAMQPDATIVTVTSGLAFVPLVAAATYSATKAAIHSYIVSLREALKDRIEVIELAPPAVHTGLTRGQEHRPAYLPLHDFADLVMAEFAKAPAPAEVDRAIGLRNAEAERRFADQLRAINAFAAQARADQPG